MDKFQLNFCLAFWYDQLRNEQFLDLFVYTLRVSARLRLTPREARPTASNHEEHALAYLVRGRRILFFPSFCGGGGLAAMAGHQPRRCLQ